MDDVIKRLMVAGLFVMLGACSAPTAFQSTDRLTRGQTVHRILLMPVDVELSLLTAGGIQQPHAEWTAKAKAHIKPALRNVLKRHNVELIEYAAKGGGNDLAEQHVQLVSSTVPLALQSFAINISKIFFYPRRPTNSIGPWGPKRLL